MNLFDRIKFLDESTKNMLIIMLLVFVIISILFIIALVTSRSKPKYESVINPELVDDKQIQTLGKKIKKEGKLTKEIKKIVEKRGLSEKVEDWYFKAGLDKKGLDYFITQNFKYLFFGIVSGILLYIIFQNIIISVLAGLVVTFLHVIDLFSTINERKKYFVEKFPFFLKTMSFAMKNSSSFSVAFREVIDKTEDGVLKEVMTEVLEEQRLNGGDFNAAFQLLVEKIDSEETKEFVETINTNATKGIPIAKSFDTQADSITTQANNRKMKLIKNLDNKIMIPILLILASVALLMWGVLGAGGV